MRRPGWLARWIEKHFCDRNRLVVQALMYEGSTPMVVVQMEHACTGQIVGSVAIEPDHVVDLVKMLVECQTVARDPSNWKDLIN